MDDYLSEDEKVEALRKWWSENGKFIIAGIGLGVLGLIGWNRYQANLEKTAASGSVVYERLLDAVGRGDSDVAIASQDELDRDFSSTPYPAQGLLAMARLHLDNGQPESARDALRELIETDAPREILLVGRLRLARVLLYLDRPDEALVTIDGVDPGSFRSRYDEVRGDIEVAKGDTEAARQAYQAAIDNAGTPPLVDVQLVQMKLADLRPATVDDVMESENSAGAEQ